MTLTYNVRIHEVKENTKTLSVRATIDEETVAQTFPLGEGWEEIQQHGAPRFVEELVEQRKRIEEKKLQTSGVEETFEGNEYSFEPQSKKKKYSSKGGGNSKNFKGENK